jgi:hypothetical protein
MWLFDGDLLCCHKHSKSAVRCALDTNCEPLITPGSELDKDVATKFVYDTSGNVIDLYQAYKDPANPDTNGRPSAEVRTRTPYDALNRKVAVIANYQDGIHLFGSEDTDKEVISQTFFDKVGNVQITVDARHNVTWLCYDVRNRLTKSIANVRSHPLDLRTPPNSVPWHKYTLSDKPPFWDEVIARYAPLAEAEHAARWQDTPYAPL